MGYKIFTLSPGSTSTKLAVFDGEEMLFKANVTHDPEKLKTFKRVSEQKPYRGRPGKSFMSLCRKQWRFLKSKLKKAAFTVP